MSFTLSPRNFGTPRSAAELAVMRVCEEVFTAFCDLMDRGDVEAAVELHSDDLVFYDVGRAEPMVGKEPLRARLKKVRFSYPGRKTLHIPSNFRFHEVTDKAAECRVVIALYDIVRMPGGKGIGSNSTELLGYAEEAVRFVLADDGCWKFQTRQVAFIGGAKQLPIGTLPKDLPWDKEG